MYRDRTQVRDLPVRAYFNEHELEEVQEGADLAGAERASFIRDASLVIARVIKRMKEQQRQVSLSEIQARLNGDFKYSLA